MAVESDENAGFEATIDEICDKTEILRRRKAADAIHMISRFPLSPSRFQNIEFPNTLIRLSKKPKVEDLEKLRVVEEELTRAGKLNSDMQIELDEQKKHKCALEVKRQLELRKMEEMKVTMAKNEYLVQAGHTVMLRFFLEYVYGAITHGRNKRVASVIDEAAGGIIKVCHSVDGELPKTLDIHKHSGVLSVLDRVKGELSNAGCHSGSIAGIAVAVQIQRGMHDLLTPELLEQMSALFQDLFGISVDEAAEKGENTLYGQKLETQSRSQRKVKLEPKKSAS